MHGAIPPLPNMPSWHGAELKKAYCSCDLAFAYSFSFNMDYEYVIQLMLLVFIAVFQVK
jgi:hypothetical protein